jgi:ATP-dependent Zn protease
MTNATEHCDRPWWKRPPLWFIAIAAALLLVVVLIQQTDKQPTMPYSVLLDQIEAGNVASVSFQGTEITGRFKRPVADKLPTGTAQRDSFRSRVPDFGDPALIPELHRQHVVIEVTAPSAWSWLLGRVPWPMLIFIAAMLMAGFVRLLRGGKAQPLSAAPTLPAHGMMRLISDLFAKQHPSESPPTHGSDAPKNP